MDADYIVIGAGSAGCVLASRLSEDGARVVLLEAGPKDRNPMIHIPAGVRSLLYHPNVNWNYSTEGEAGTAGRRIHWPRGKVLGGSSSINGMQYVRGNAADYDGWAQRGCIGWSYDDVLPYFRKSENYRDGGDWDYRGNSGVLEVQDARTALPLTDCFIEAAQQAGHRLNPDYNGAKQEGVSYSQMTRKGRFRGSTASTYLASAKSRPNLQIETNSLATKLFSITSVVSVLPFIKVGKIGNCAQSGKCCSAVDRLTHPICCRSQASGQALTYSRLASTRCMTFRGLAVTCRIITQCGLITGSKVL